MFRSIKPNTPHTENTALKSYKATGVLCLEHSTARRRCARKRAVAFWLFFNPPQSTQKLSLIIWLTTLKMEIARSNCSIILPSNVADPLVWRRTQSRWCRQTGLHPAPGLLLALPHAFCCTIPGTSTGSGFFPSCLCHGKLRFSPSRLRDNEEKHTTARTALVYFLRLVPEGGRGAGEHREE